MTKVNGAYRVCFAIGGLVFSLMLEMIGLDSPH